MDNRAVKYFYYRGVRFTKNLIVKNVDAAKEFTYRGVNFFKNQNVANVSAAKRMYRGFAI